MKSYFKKIVAISTLIFSLCSCGSNTSINSDITSSNSVEESTTSTSVETKRTTYSNLVNIYDAFGNNQNMKTIVADPSIIRGDDGTYYLYCTETYLFRGERGYGKDKGPILKSKNLVDWDYAGSVFRYGKDEPVWGASGANVWAPDVCKIGDKYVYYYSLALWGDGNPGIGCASSDTPYGPWTQHGKIFDSKEIGVNNSIDPQVLIDDGKVYMVWGSFMGIYGIELSADGLSVKNPETMKKDKFLIAGPGDNTWHFDSFEGSYIIKHEDKYVYFGSAGSCCDGLNSTYHVRAGLADSFKGDYIDKRGVSLKNHDGAGELVIGNDKEKVVGVGHNAVTRDDNGDYWLIYHGYDVKDPSLGRRLFIDKLLWDEQGYPYVEGRKASIREEKPAPVIND